MTEDIVDIDFTEKDVEGKNLVSGGVAIRRVPIKPTESITLKMNPVSAGLMNESTATGVSQHFHPQTSDDNTQPISVSTTLNRNQYRLVFLWSELLPATASTQPTATPSLRWQMFNAYVTNINWDYSDKELTAEVTFKWATLQKDGTRNMIIDSSDDSAQIAAVTAYT